MTDLPQLPEPIRRLQAVRWRVLLEKYGFDKDYLKWHESPYRRHQVARPNFSLAPPPPGGRQTFFDPQGKPISYDAWLQQQRETWLARESDPTVIDLIGTDLTLNLARERFSQNVEDYFLWWASNTDGDSNEFTEWLEAIRQSVVAEVSDLWRKTEWHSAWFDRACHKRLDQALRDAGTAECSRACNFENQHLKLRDLTSAPGVANTEGALSQAATGRQVEASSRAPGAGFSITQPVPAAVEDIGGKARQKEGTAPEPNNRGRKRGPKSDYENASRAAEIVGRLAPDGDWRPTLADIREALDNEMVPIPKTWRRKRQCQNWDDCVERAIIIKAIEYRLRIAKDRTKPSTETFS